MYITDPNHGWNAGAHSRNIEPGDCIATFSVPDTVVGVVCGLTAPNEAQDYRNIAHALYFTRGGGIPIVSVMESGTTKTTGFTFATEDVFTIRRMGSLVQYLKNATLLYSSLVPSAGAVVLDASLYSAGDEIR